MKYDYHIAVIGGGSAGLVVASGAAGLGAKVALIEGHKMGGDCLNYGCVPSKAFLKSAHLAADIRHASALGLNAQLGDVDLEKVMDRVRDVIAEIEPHDSVERYEGLGVDVFQGMGAFVDKHTVKVNDREITAKSIVICTGSTAAVPPIPGLDTVPFMTNHTVFDMTVLPERLLVLGAGPIGLELGQGFRHLGSDVAMIDMLPQLFPKDDPEVAPILEAQAKKEGINLVLSAKILGVSKTGDEILVEIEQDGKKSVIVGDALLVSLGRRPVTKGLNLGLAGVALNERGFVPTDKRLRTSVKNIYACGDVTGPFQFTHMAGYQAGIVIRNCIFRLPAKVDYSIVPWATFTKPEVAHVGYTEPWAKSEGLYVDNILVPLAGMDRAKADYDRVGFLKLILGKKRRIIGVTLVGEKAGEMTPLATLAIAKKLKASAFLNMIFAYPTQAEIYKFASLQEVKASFKPWMKTLIRWLFL
ncbi:MAG: pyruvate/2-oxoglutarate dehydrogenase complex dihydrolipoamide dehydrogenase (E3) component [Candidatus Marinamargulisbacteria bacterium]|jgi:pyruvate/2-oxoglutarate dehydrogenase complex dihydrolipoamide dehydrogenase (E3) component